MFIHTKTLKIAAEMPKEDAKNALRDAYPGWTLSSFAEVERDGERIYTATISISAAEDELPPVADEPVVPEEDSGPAAEPEDDTDHNAEKGDGKPTLESLQADIAHLTRGINKILDAVGGGSDEGDDMAPPPAHKHKDPAAIPPPIEPPFGQTVAPKPPGGGLMLSRKADISQRDALAEIRGDILLARIPGVPRTASVKQINLIDGEYRVIVGD